MGLAFDAESSETVDLGSRDNDNPLTCDEMRNERDAMREIFQREMARHEEQIVNLKDQNAKLKEQNDKLKERNARLEQNRDKQLQDLRRKNEVVRLADSEINQSIMRQRDSGKLTEEYCRQNADKMKENIATNKKKLTECGRFDEELRTRLVNTPSGQPDGQSGRLEVFVGGEWGSVCSTWLVNTQRGNKLAKVVCKSLGFSSGVRVVNGKMGGNAANGTPIFMDYIVECTGNERSIHDCPWRRHSIRKYQRYCNNEMMKNKGKHTLDVGIECY